MNPTQAAAVLFGSAGLMVAWFAVPPAKAPTAMTPPSASDFRQSDAVAAALTVETSRLRTFIESQPSPQPISRNVFRFDEPRPRRVVAPPRPEATEVIEPIAAPSPPLSLIGIAEDASASGPVRTAIVSGMGQLFLVKEGEQVAEVFRVLRVGAESVELLNTRDNTTVRIALK